MNSAEHTSRVVSYAVQNWHRTFGGTSALEIAAELSIPHNDVLAILEELSAQGKGRFNRLGVTADMSTLARANFCWKS